MNTTNAESPFFIPANLSNSSNSSMPPPIASVPIRLFGAISYAFLSSISVLMNVLLIAVLTHGHSQFRRLAFFTLAWQMIACDLMTQAVQLIIAVPVTFAGEAVYGHPFWYYAILFCDTFAYNATLHFSGLLTLSRLCIFFFPRLNQLLFAPSNIGYTICGLWLYLIGYCACWNLVGCRKAFSETEFYMFHECPDPLPPAGILFRQISFIMSTYLPLLMLIAYIFCFVYIRYFFGPTRSNRIRGASIRSLASSLDREQQRIERMRRQREKNFLIQSFLICGFLEVQNLAFDFVPLICSSLQGQWTFVATFAENWISILLNTISPLILFAFNREVRKCLAQLLPPIVLLHFLRGPSRTRTAPAAPNLTHSLTIAPSQLMGGLNLNQQRKSHPSISLSISRHSLQQQPQNQNQQHRQSTSAQIEIADENENCWEQQLNSRHI